MGSDGPKPKGRHAMRAITRAIYGGSQLYVGCDANDQRKVVISRDGEVSGFANHSDSVGGALAQLELSLSTKGSVESPQEVAAEDCLSLLDGRIIDGYVLKVFAYGEEILAALYGTGRVIVPPDVINRVRETGKPEYVVRRGATYRVACEFGTEPVVSLEADARFPEAQYSIRVGCGTDLHEAIREALAAELTEVRRKDIPRMPR